MGQPGSFWRLPVVLPLLLDALDAARVYALWYSWGVCWLVCAGLYRISQCAPVYRFSLICRFSPIYRVCLICHCVPHVLFVPVYRISHHVRICQTCPGFFHRVPACARQWICLGRLRWRPWREPVCGAAALTACLSLRDCHDAAHRAMHCLWLAVLADLLV